VPELQKAPAEVHAGVEATGDVPQTFMGRFTRALGEKVTPGLRRYETAQASGALRARLGATRGGSSGILG
jgi:hypothetical protein